MQMLVQHVMLQMTLMVLRRRWMRRDDLQLLLLVIEKARQHGHPLALGLVPHLRSLPLATGQTGQTNPFQLLRTHDPAGADEGLQAWGC